MLYERNREIILQFYRAFDERRIEQAVELLAPSFIAHLAGIPEPLNIEQFKQFGMKFYLAFSQGRHIFDEVILAEDKVITSGTFTAIHSGEFQGLPPSGKQISLSVMHIDKVEDGKIVEHWGQGDALGLMQQLGIVFFPHPKLVMGILRSNISQLFKRH